MERKERWHRRFGLRCFLFPGRRPVGEDQKKGSTSEGPEKVYEADQSKELSWNFVCSAPIYWGRRFPFTSRVFLYLNIKRFTIWIIICILYNAFSDRVIPNILDDPFQIFLCSNDMVKTRPLPYLF
jgi:hypothetical protein